MLFRYGLRSEAACTVLAEIKLAPWFMLARVCAGVCSDLMSNRPSTRYNRKSRPSNGPMPGFAEVVNGSWGHCSGPQVVFVLSAVVAH